MKLVQTEKGSNHGWRSLSLVTFHLINRQIMFQITKIIVGRTSTMPSKIIHFEILQNFLIFELRKKPTGIFELADSKSFSLTAGAFLFM